METGTQYDISLLGNFSCFFLLAADFYHNQLFRNILSGVPCIWVSNSLEPDQARSFVGLIWFQAVCEKLSAEDTRRQLSALLVWCADHTSWYRNILKVKGLTYKLEILFNVSNNDIITLRHQRWIKINLYIEDHALVFHSTLFCW